MSERLTGKACIVTGAGAGIGLAIARAFAVEGAKVVVNDASAEAADSAVEVLRSEGGEAVANHDAIGRSPPPNPYLQPLWRISEMCTYS